MEESLCVTTVLSPLSPCERPCPHVLAVPKSSPVQPPPSPSPAALAVCLRVFSGKEWRFLTSVSTPNGLLGPGARLTWSACQLWAQTWETPLGAPRSSACP